MMKMKSIVTAVLVAATMSVATVGCTMSQSYDAVCVNKTSHVRVSDAECQSHGTPTTGFLWYYIATSNKVPAVGSAAKNGTYKAPASSSTVNKGVTTKGGYTDDSGKGSFTEPHVGGGSVDEGGAHPVDIPAEGHVVGGSR